MSTLMIVSMLALITSLTGITDGSNGRQEDLAAIMASAPKGWAEYESRLERVSSVKVVTRESLVTHKGEDITLWYQETTSLCRDGELLQTAWGCQFGGRNNSGDELNREAFQSVLASLSGREIAKQPARLHACNEKYYFELEAREPRLREERRQWVITTLAMSTDDAFAKTSPLAREACFNHFGLTRIDGQPINEIFFGERYEIQRVERNGDCVIVAFSEREGWGDQYPRLIAGELYLDTSNHWVINRSTLRYAGKDAKLGVIAYDELLEFEFQKNITNGIRLPSRVVSRRDSNHEQYCIPVGVAEWAVILQAPDPRVFLLAHYGFVEPAFDQQAPDIHSWWLWPLIGGSCIVIGAIIRKVAFTGHHPRK